MTNLTKEQAIERFTSAKAHWNNLFAGVYHEWVNLYNSIRVKPSNVASWRSNIFIPLTFSIIQEQLPKDCDTLFSSGAFFSLLPREGKSKEEAHIDAYKRLLDYYLDTTGAYLQFYNAVLSAEQFPLGWVQLSWNYSKTTRKYYDLKEGKVVEVDGEVVTDEPLITWRPFNTVFPDPSATSRRNLTYVATEWVVSREELETYKNASWADKTIINNMLTSDAANFTLKGVYTTDEVIWLNENNDILRQHLTPFKRPTLPFYFICKIPQLGSIYGVGLTQILGDLNKWVNLIENLKNDNLMLSVNKAFQKVKSTEVDPTQLSVGPGTIIEHDMEDQFLREIPMGTVNPQAFTEVERILAIMNRMVGSVAGVTYQDDLLSASNRTATEAVILSEESSRRHAIFSKYNKESFIEPLLRDLLELIQIYAPDEKIREVLGEDADTFIKERREEDIDTRLTILITGEDAAYSKSLQLQRIQLALQLLNQLGPAALADLNVEVLVDRIVKLTGMPKELLNKGIPEQPLMKQLNGTPDLSVLKSPKYINTIGDVVSQDMERDLSNITKDIAPKV